MEQVFREMYRSGVVPVVTLPDPERAVKLARALLRGGIGVLEIAMRNSEAADCIRAVRTRCPEIVVGAGTVLTPAQARTAGSDRYSSRLSKPTPPAGRNFTILKGAAR